ncbi:MAG: peroxiredoxin family protein [Cyclobacteriaceae bacterium]
MFNLFFTSGLLLLLISCQKNPDDVLKKAKENLDNSSFISYRHSGIFPVPTGKIDTLTGTAQFSRRKNKHLDYDIIGTGKRSDIVYINDEFKRVSHKDSMITYYTPEDLEKEKYLFEDLMVIDFGPVGLLNDGKWKFVKDTMISNIQFFNYYLIDMDTVIREKKIYLEKHIFINTATSLVERYERRLFHDGENAQFIECSFSEYDLRKDPVELSYSDPIHYTSRMASEKEKVFLLEECMKAPDFEGKDMEGNTIQLSDLRGQMVLVNFSMIHCGWCKIALEEFNKDGFNFADGITALYINPVDSKTDMEKYLEKFKVPFPVITEAKEIGKSYGVSGYPTFYLINEKGVIEKVFAGYNDSFINSLRK